MRSLAPTLECSASGAAPQASLRRHRRLSLRPRLRQPERRRGRLHARRRLMRLAGQAHATGYLLATHADDGRRGAELAEMRAIAAGDEAAFARLIDRESPRLLRFSAGVLGSLEEAEDVVQEALIRLWENAGRWTPEARIGTWLHTVCYNGSIDRLRRRRNVVGESALDDVPDPGGQPDRALLRGETVRSVRDALERLPVRQRTAVLLFHFQDLSVIEAAFVMDVSEGAFESLLARARRQLRAWLAAAGGENE